MESVSIDDLSLLYDLNFSFSTSHGYQSFRNFENGGFFEFEKEFAFS